MTIATYRPIGRAYEGAMSTPERRRVVNANNSQDAAAERAYPALREWGRYLDENHPTAVGLLHEWVKGTVGSGITTIPQPVLPSGEIDEALGVQLMDRFAKWGERCDVTGELSWGRAQRLICRAWPRDGEHFIQHVMGRRYPVPVGDTPYKLELLESDMCPADFHDADRGIRYGIQMSEWRRPQRYYFYLHHPGDIGAAQAPMAQAWETKPVDAGIITHLKHTLRWPATRGVSLLAPLISTLYDIKDLEESERMKNRALASWTAAIERDISTPGHADPIDETGRRYIGLEGGTIIDTLRRGEKIVGVGPEYPVSGMEEYIADQHRRVASGGTVRYSALTKRYDGSYSSMRQELVDGEGYQRIREDDFVCDVARPVYRRFVTADVLAGHTRLRPGQSLEMAWQAEYRGVVTPWVQPLQEVQADIAAIEGGLMSLEQAQIKRGASPQLMRETKAREAAAGGPAQLRLIDDEENSA